MMEEYSSSIDVAHAEHVRWDAIMEMVRCMMKGRTLNDHFWVEVVQTMIFLLNLSPTKAIHGNITYKAWPG
jgi:hypothetical protein